MNKTKFARQLRQNETKAESIFWAEVRGRQFKGLKFKRQVPINKYFADFVCEEKKVIIELDDRSHDDRLDKDAERTKVLEKYGYRVIRFTNEEIYEYLDGCFEFLDKELE
jgi:very-short-patch-repair endonuclease